jgi:SAM-dependent methyltransferase
VSDSESGYKFFRRETVLALLAETRDPGWFWDTEIMIRAVRAGCRIVEVPCLFLRNFRKPSTVRGIRDSLVYLLRVAAFRRRLGGEERAAQSDSYWRGRGEEFADLYRPRGLFARFVGAFLDRRAKLIDGWLVTGPGQRALDAGCGHGLHLVSLAKRGARVTGVDVSTGMLARARHDLEAAGCKDAVLVCASAEAVTLPANDFDLVLAIGLLDYLADWRDMLRRLAGWTKPGGRVVFTVPKRPSPFGFLRRGPGLALRGALFGLPPILVAVNRAELEAAAKEAGLRIDEVASCQGTMWAVRAVKP